MTFKLVKYEFRSILKLMGIVWIALPVTALITGFFDRIVFPDDGLTQDYPALASLVTSVTNFLYFAFFVALIAVTIMIVIMRFYKGMLRDEGYLMHTLPVKTWQLITAKGVVAVCVSLISVAVAGLSILLLTVSDIPVFIVEIIGHLVEMVREKPFLLVLGLEWIVFFITLPMAVIYKVYASLSIGQLARKHRIALSAGAYIGMDIAGLILLYLVGNVLVDIVDSMLDYIDPWLSRLTVYSAAGLILLTMILYETVQIVIYHIISEQILRRKLNLE